jgi:hypothetical protein
MRKADQATAETAMRGAAGMVFSMEANNTLPSSSKDAYMAIDSMSVSGDIPGWKSGNFNIQMSEIKTTIANQPTQRAATAWIGSLPAHDGTHARQFAAGKLPETNFPTDPIKHGGSSWQQRQFVQAVIRSEHEADQVQSDFLSAVAGLPQNVRDNLIGSISNRSSVEIGERYEGRVQDATPSDH